MSGNIALDQIVRHALVQMSTNVSLVNGGELGCDVERRRS